MITLKPQAEQPVYPEESWTRSPGGKGKRDTTLSLCLVSSWCYQLALPYLLTTIILPAPTSVKRFLALLSLQSDGGIEIDCKPCMPSEYVQTLGLSPNSQEIYDMVVCCHNAC
ncbi:hypothetical protein PTI98_011695 [Pleurotus ostreatus]|nr:hypothetical protein PTI98_011695 [Pleurotus ostreatus]